MEMDDESDEDYNEDGEEEEEEEEEGDDDEMPLLHQTGADIPPSFLHDTVPSTRGKAPVTRGVAPVTKPIPRAASISSSSGGSDIPHVLPSYRRGTSGSSSQATVENTASLKRGFPVGGGSVLKRPRISNIADGVITSRLNEQQSSAVLQSRRRSDATRPMGFSDEQEPHITNIESDVTTPGSIATPTFNTGAHVSRVDPNQSAQSGHDPYALPEHLTHAEDGRPYISMPGIDPSIKTKGALFPTGYQLRLDQQAPFVCAVRSCQTLLPTLKGLGSHFIVCLHPS
ncbi:hypothetical protein F5X68DRAFT_188196 [Plectosphaerella plurivora]|uniref:Uncharacterized protein n=1 Tax=Plectosphaerella plurivora TaxID=936078 RepID=A0A9P9AG02_9PEZI|nr:hypothetical protein F5X68DRAFT_188196 [Plectosphaerella plurivora]